MMSLSKEHDRTKPTVSWWIGKDRDGFREAFQQQAERLRNVPKQGLVFLGGGNKQMSRPRVRRPSEEC